MQAAHNVDLVNENNDPAGDAREYDLLDRHEPTLQRPQFLVLVPEFEQLILQIQLLAQARNQPVVPLINGQILSNGGKVKHRHSNSVLTQPLHGAHHEG